MSIESKLSPIKIYAIHFQILESSFFSNHDLKNRELPFEKLSLLDKFEYIFHLKWNDIPLKTSFKLELILVSYKTAKIAFGEVINDH